MLAKLSLERKAEVVEQAVKVVGRDMLNRWLLKKNIASINYLKEKAEAFSDTLYEDLALMVVAEQHKDNGVL